MDYHGSAASHLQWKCYGTSQNNSETPSGLAYTWTYVPYFYTYARDNTGYGLCADVDVYLYYAQEGERIFDIAKRYHARAKDLAAANHLETGGTAPQDLTTESTCLLIPAAL